MHLVICLTVIHKELAAIEQTPTAAADHTSGDLPHSYPSNVSVIVQPITKTDSEKNASKNYADKRPIYFQKVLQRSCHANRKCAFSD
ncbi:unnamed protein product [Urochloa humidicola]